MPSIWKLEVLMRLSPLFTLSLLVTTWQTAFSATTDDCSKIKTDTERLSCYDKIFKPDQKSADTESQEEEKKGWIIRKETSKIDDSISYYLILFSDDFIDESEKEHGAIAIACPKKTTTIIFDTGENYLVDNGDYDRVTYRLDKEKAKTIPMEVAKGHKAIGLWSGAKSIPFIKEMFGHDKMVVQITPYQKGPVTMEFSISGLEEAIKPIREECKW